MKIKPNSRNYFSFEFDTEKVEHNEKWLLKELKDKIPSSGRKWFPDSKKWLIHKDYFDSFILIVNQYIHRIIFSQQDLF